MGAQYGQSGEGAVCVSKVWVPFRDKQYSARQRDDRFVLWDDDGIIQLAERGRGHRLWFGLCTSIAFSSMLATIKFHCSTSYSRNMGSQTRPAPTSIHTIHQS